MCFDWSERSTLLLPYSCLLAATPHRSAYRERHTTSVQPTIGERGDQQGAVGVALRAGELDGGVDRAGGGGEGDRHETMIRLTQGCAPMCEHPEERLGVFDTM